MSELSSTVLIVDDDPVTCELFSILLERSSIKVVTAATPAQAHDLVLSHTPDLILLDLNLGDVDGLELTRELRERFGAVLPLLVVSASSEVEVQQRARAAGATGFIPKPVDPRTFATQVKSYLPEKTNRFDIELDRRERRLNELRAQFVATALASLEQLTKRKDDELFQDTLLADAAHKWVGASSIEGMPDVENIAREVEMLARAKRTDQAPYLRQQLQWLQAQFRESSQRLTTA
jgi:two-component system cell cycle response regulator DivK